MRVRLGFFPAFKGADTLLLEGDADGLARLARALAALATEASKPVALESLEFVETRRGVKVTASRAPRDLGISRRDGSAFDWELSRAGWEDVVDLLHPVARSSPSHQYLDQRRRVTVMASQGEYDDAWWAEHG